MDISFRMLEAFKVVAETENLTKAAKKLYISQGQLSRIIANIEKNVGASLFDRSRGRLFLNACGKEYYKYILEINFLTKQVYQSVQDIYMHERAQITLTSNATAHMPALLKLIKEKLPELNLRQIASTGEQIKSMLAEGKADFAICFPPLEEPEFENRLLCYEYAAIIYPHGHIFSTQSNIALDDLKGEALICAVKGFAARDAGDMYFASKGLIPNISVETAEQAQIVEYVKAGLGIGVVPRCLIDSDPFLIEHSKILEETPSMSLSLAWKHDREFSSTDTLFLNAVVEYFDKAVPPVCVE